MDNLNPDGGTGRRMLLLGGLSALALNAEARRRVASGARDLLGETREVADDAVGAVKPALATAAAEAGQVVHQTARGTARAADTLRGEASDHAGSLLDRAGDVAEAASKTVTGAATAATARAAEVAHDLHREVTRGVRAVGGTAQDLAGDAGRALGGTRRQVGRELRAGQAQGARAAAKAARTAEARRRQGERLLEDTQAHVTREARARKAQGARAAREAALSAQTTLRRAERAATAARQDAEKELRAMRQGWGADQIEREVRRQVGSLPGQTKKELARLRKQEGRQARAVRAEDGSSGGGGLTALVLLVMGAVVLARVPAARQGILGVVGRVSPGAAESLHRASRNARDLVGSMWLEHIEEPAPAPAPGAARGTQAATPGAPSGGSPAAGSPAASGTQAPPQNPGPKTN